MSRIDIQTSSRRFHSPPHRCGDMPLSMGVLIVLSLVVKLLLLNWNLAEYTDGIIQLTLWNSPVVFFPPGYSALIWVVNLFVHDLLIAGRLVSIFSSIGSLLALFFFAQAILQNEKEAYWATLFLALSPVFNRWSLRVMTDSCFCFLFIVNCHLFITAWRNPNRSLSPLLAMTGIAALFRYQAFYFVPLWMYLLIKRGSAGVSISSPHPSPLPRGEGKLLDTYGSAGASPARIKIFHWLLAIVPWMILTGWIFYRGFGHTQQFVERASYGFWTTLALYFNMFETFMLYWPWAITYGLFFLGILGWIQFVQPDNQEKPFLYFFGLTAIVFLIVQSCFLSFQYRYLLPLVPLWCILGARGYGVLQQKIHSPLLRRGCTLLVIMNLVAMSLAVWYFQRATFGDLVESAKFIREVGTGSRVLSDEVYRSGVNNVKMRFWSGREVLYYNPIFPQESETQPQNGDILVLHNTYTDVPPALENLKQKFDVIILKTWSEETHPGRFTTLPLLPDIMVNPPRMTSNPPCMALRFTPQSYYSLVLRLMAKKG